MAATQKIERLIDQVADALNLKYPDSCVKAYDASHDAYLTMTVGGSQVALIKFGTVAQLATGAGNPVTGLTDTVFVPDVVRVGFDNGAQASGEVTQAAPDAAGVVAKATVTVGDDLTAGDVMDINGALFTAVDSGAGANQFDITGVQADGDVTVLADLTAGDADTGPDTVVLGGVTITPINTSAVPGDEQFGLNVGTSTPASGTVTVGADLTAGD
jgi:hypothetical protein